MSLTAGTSLQNGKYVIQSVLEQSDFGTTYQATHVYLDQPVILQTLENKHSDPDKVAWFEQQFLAGVRRLNKGEHSYPGRVLDYFTENQTPYVSLEFIQGHPLPKVIDWLLSSPQSDQSNGAKEAVKDSQNSDPVVNTLATGVPTIVQVTTALQESNGAIANGSSTNGSTSNGSPTNGAATNSSSTNGISSRTQLQQNTVLVTGERSPTPSPTVKRKTSPWLPASLLMTTAVAGLAGAGFGLTLRFNPPTTQSHPIFSNEQAFPPVEGWPVQEEITDNFAPSEWERPAERVYEAPIRDRYPVPRVERVDPFDPEKVTLPEEEAIPKTPTEFEGGDPLAPEELPLPEPAADTSLPPADPVYEPPAPVAPAPPPAVEPAPVAPDPATQEPAL